MNKYYIKSIEGASHKESGLPCQDSSMCETFDNNQACIIAISDGHGSQTYVRSHIGSSLACQIAIKETKQFVSDYYDTLASKGTVSYSPDFGIELDPFFSNLFTSIHDQWHEAIKNDAKTNPFSREEKRKLGASNIKLAYGCTLIVAVKTKDFTFAYHLGDGRLFTILYSGEWKQSVPWDSACEDNITTSLCESNPVNRFRFFLDSTNNQPYAIFMCSDGIEDCYGGSHDGNFKSERLIVDYEEVLRCYLQDEDFDKACCDFLDYQSNKFSHDDMSIAFIIDDVYNLQNKWLQLTELHRMVYEIKSTYGLLKSQIKDYYNRITNVQANIDNCANEIKRIQAQLDDAENNLKNLGTKQETESKCVEAASRFNIKIGEFQTDVKKYCEVFNECTDSTLSFRRKLTDDVLNAITNMLVLIRNDISEKRDSDSILVGEIEQIKEKINKLNEQKMVAELDLEKEIGKLKNLRDKKKQIEQEAENYKTEKELDINKYTEDAKKIKADIQQCFPTQVDRDDSVKVLNISKYTCKAPEDYITIVIQSGQISGAYNGSNNFEISREEFNNLLLKIKDTVYSEYNLTSEYIVIMEPYNDKENRGPKYISLEKEEAIEIWEMCLTLSQNHTTI